MSGSFVSGVSRLKCRSHAESIPKRVRVPECSSFTPKAIICICMLRTASNSVRKAFTQAYQRTIDEERKKPSKRPTKTLRKVPSFSNLSALTSHADGNKCVTTATVTETSVLSAMHLHKAALSQAQPLTMVKAPQVVMPLMLYRVLSHSFSNSSISLPPFLSAFDACCSISCTSGTPLADDSAAMMIGSRLSCWWLGHSKLHSLKV
mmetsp:Transcript_25909/g.49628  ORF Transcript_25909/g.49628 Transcript_25909/m.49628 type:complete len:206 (+) Transcript_25909:221-838(+)